MILLLSETENTRKPLMRGTFQQYRIPMDCTL